MKRSAQTLFLALALFFASTLGLVEQARAHGGEGLTLSATSTGEGMASNIVDVDYSDAAIQAGVIGRFDFKLYSDSERTKPVNFTNMWIRIREDDGSRVGKLLFAGAVAKQEFGGNGFSFRFPNGGKYTLSVRYNDESKGRLGETVAEAEFSLDVLRSEDEDTFSFSSMEFWVGLIGGFCVAALGILLVIMRKNHA